MKRFKYLVSFMTLMSIGLNSCTKTPTTATFTLNTLNNPISMLTEAQKAYMNDEYKNILMHTGNMGEMSKPNPINLSFKISTDGNIDANQYTCHIWNEELNKDLYYSSKETSFDIYNVERGFTYQYEFFATYKGKKNCKCLSQFSSMTSSFTTLAEFPRTLNIDGTTNVRDLVGVGNIKQGRLFRSAEFNDGESENFKLKISESGIYALDVELGIKSEIDVRKDSETGKQSECAFNSEKNYFHLPMGYSGPVQVMTYKDETIDNLKSIKSFFETLANKENLPAIYHCTFGRDRTGFLSYLVGALCGGDEDQLYRDYLFTDFSDMSPVMVNTINGTSAYPAVINNCVGDTLKEKVINYLTLDDNKHPGISIDVLNSVINNLCD